MRENNHIFTRNNYQDLSSYKIRQPLDDKFHINRSSQYQDYGSHESHIKLTTKNINRQTALGGYYLSQVKKPTSTYDDRSQNHSRDFSYQSKGSNISKNSIKMSDYVALEARNLLNNKDKYRYEGQQNHARSSSMQYYPKTSMKFNSKHHQYTVDKNEQQLCEIPSFGIQCRSTISSYDKASTFIQNKSRNEFDKQQSFEQSCKLRKEKLKTQIDERIQRLHRVSSTSQHKQRLSNIKVLDANRIQNMDKINIKIKNILRTLQNEQDHYRRNFTTTTIGNNNDPSNNRIKTVQSMSLKYDDVRHSVSRVVQKEQRTLNKHFNNLSQVNSNSDNINKYYPQHKQLQRSYVNDISGNKYDKNDINKYSCYSRFTNTNNNLNQKQQQQQQSFQNHTTIQHFPPDNINVSSYYCYDDNQQAILKSSQSPIKSSSQKSCKKYSVSKQDLQNQKETSFIAKKYQQNKPIKTNYQEYKINNYPQFNQNTSQKIQSQQKQYQQDKNFNKKTDNHSILNDIPQCETQLIESKAIQNLNSYHTFESHSRQYDEKTPQIYKQIHAIKTLSISQEVNSQQPYMKDIDEAKFNKKQESNNILMERFSYHKKSNEVYLKQKTQQKKCKTINYETKGFKIQNSSQIVPNTYFRSNTNPICDDINQNNERRQRNHFTTNEPNYFYYDSIKQTPRIQQRGSDIFFDENLINNKKTSYEKRSQSYSHQNNQLQNKLKSYQKRIQDYNRQMSASKLLDTKRSKSENKTQKNLSDREFVTKNFDDKSLSNHTVISQRNNIDKMISQIKKQRANKEYQHKSPKKSTSRENRQIQNINQNCHQQYQSSLRKSAYQHQSSKKAKSPRQSHRFAKQDHHKFIENLKKQREQVAALSKRKNLQQNSTSIDFSRLSPLQRSNLRSQSQNSRLSSVTIVKGKNVDAEIEKLQKKMQHYEQMKKQLHLESQQNTQRSLNKNKENLSSSVKKQSPMTLSRKLEFKQKSPRREKSVRFEQPRNLQSKQQSKRENNDILMSRINSTQRRNELLKIVAEQNSYVKVRKSIIKEQKTTGIKNYLDEKLEKQNSRPQSVRKQRTQNSIQKQNTSQKKENIIPSGSRAIETQSYNKPIGQQKKVILGLAQNLNNYQKQQQINNNKQNGQIQNDVNTPKLLRNLKNKLTDKSIVKKKAQKRGFRSQFINDLHQDNELIYSAKKNEDQIDDPIEQTSRIRPECKESLEFILGKMQQQIARDEKFRNQKKLFNALTGKDKWTELMNEYVRLTKDNKISLTAVMDIFRLNEQESNPFYSTRGNEFTLQSFIRCHLQCEQNWSSLLSKVSQFSFQLLQQCGLNSRSLDIEKKGFIDIEDLTRFLNMEMNRYYRKRDIYLLWKRIQTKSKQYQKINQPYSIMNLTIDQLLTGLGGQKN